MVSCDEKLLAMTEDTALSYVPAGALLHLDGMHLFSSIMIMPLCA
jgi:hypothetical protein